MPLVRSRGAQVERGGRMWQGGGLLCLQISVARSERQPQMLPPKHLLSLLTPV